jgi:hypothetical protein
VDQQRGEHENAHPAEDDVGAVDEAGEVLNQQRVRRAAGAILPRLGRVVEEQREGRHHARGEVAVDDEETVEPTLRAPARKHDQEVEEEGDGDAVGQPADREQGRLVGGDQHRNQPGEADADHERSDHVVGAAVPGVEARPDERPGHQERERCEQQPVALVIALDDDQEDGDPGHEPRRREPT